MGDQPRYRQIANDLRAAIYRNEYPPGSRLPRQTEMAARYSVVRQTVIEAIRLLESEGLVETRGKGGTVVRQRGQPRQITRIREVHRDEIGYFFDTAAQGWRALAPVEIERVPVPWDIARLLEIEPGSPVLVRDRIMGEPETAQVMQLTTSYLPLTLVEELPVLEAIDTGPGGIYDRLEEAGHGPLRWFERISARAANPREIELLRLAAGVPVLRVVRTAQDPTGLVREVNAITLSAEDNEIGYPIKRHSSARPPAS